MPPPPHKTRPAFCTISRIFGNPAPARPAARAHPALSFRKGNLLPKEVHARNIDFQKDPLDAP